MCVCMNAIGVCMRCVYACVYVCVCVCVYLCTIIIDAGHNDRLQLWERE